MSGISSIGTPIISYSKGMSPSGFRLDHTQSSLPTLLLLIQHSSKAPVHRSGSNYHFFHTLTYLRATNDDDDLTKTTDYL